MAKQVQITLSDDLTGGEAAETVEFGIDGKSFEIDLNEKNAQAMRKAFEKYIEKGRRSSSSRGPGRPKGSGGNKAERDFDLAALRDWAAGKGIQISPRGRIKQSIVEQFKAETGG